MTIRLYANGRAKVALARIQAFTLPEVVISLVITVIMVLGLITGFFQASVRAEWSSYALAAQSVALQAIEQARAAKWDPQAYPGVDYLVSSNFPTTVSVLDIPVVAGTPTYATNFITISLVSSNPLLKCIRVDCAWSFRDGRRNILFTNTLATLRAPDQ